MPKAFEDQPGVKTLLKSLLCVTRLYLGQDSGATLSFTLHFIVYFAPSSAPPLLRLHPPLIRENTRGHVNLYHIVRRRGILCLIGGCIRCRRRGFAFPSKLPADQPVHLENMGRSEREALSEIIFIISTSTNTLQAQHTLPDRLKHLMDNVIMR